MAGVTYLGDNGKAERDLGFDPRPLEGGLPETLAAETLAAEMRSLGLRGPDGSTARAEG